MAKYINEAFWREALSKPDWYLVLADDFRRLEELAKQQQGQPGYKQIKREAYELVEECLHRGTIPLATRGKDLDKQRKPIDTIVIHHTKNSPGMSLNRLNAMQLLRIYGMYYANPTDNRERHLRGNPVWSGHFYKDKQVFWVYHWLIRNDGSREHLLGDDYIGWHAGNWDINTRSVAICIDDDLSNKEPSDEVIESIKSLIQVFYSGIAVENIIGHSDANPSTECPGQLFHKNWQRKLLGR